MAQYTVYLIGCIDVHTTEGMNVFAMYLSDVEKTRGIFDRRIARPKEIYWIESEHHASLNT